MNLIRAKWDKLSPEQRLMVTGISTVLMIAAGIYLWAWDRVSLTVDGRSWQYATLSATVSAVLQEQRVILNPGDQVRPALTTPITEALRIEVIRSFPVRISYAGRTIQVQTIVQPVAQLLLQAGVEFNDDDWVVPGREQLIKPGQTIHLTKVTSADFSREVVLDPATEYQKDPELERGQRKIVRYGQPGRAKRLIKVFYAEGREVGRKILQEEILKPVVNTIVARGTKTVVRTLATSRGPYRYVELKLMNATAYSPGPESCGKYAVHGVTYTGKKAGFGIVAVDPREIPLGTKLYIPGYGPAEAADIGGAIKGNRIDLCFETYQEAVLFGRHQIKVYILE